MPESRYPGASTAGGIMKRSMTGLLAFGVGMALLAGSSVAGAELPDSIPGGPATNSLAASTAPSGGQPAPISRPLDTRLIKGLKSKDHTEALRKVRINLVSAPSRTVWTSTSRKVDIPMTYEIDDPRRAAKRIRICQELIDEDWSNCKSHLLQNTRTLRGDFAMKRTSFGWRIYTAPFYRPRSPALCFNHEYYRPRVKWKVHVVDPRDGSNLVSAYFRWTVRCSG